MAQKVLKKSYTNAKSYQNGFYIIICFAFLIINIYFCKTKSNILFIIISYINTNTMKKHLLFLLIVLTSLPVAMKAQDSTVVINEANFPDKAFRTKIGSATYDRNGDGKLDPTEIARIHQLDLNGSWPNYIADLTGIAFFTNIDSLSVRGNKLTSIDLSHNTKIRKLFVDNNQLASIDLSPLSDLMEFSASDNKLTSFKAGASLRRLMLDRNALTTIDLSENTVLDSISCRANKLSSLDVSKLPELRYLICNNNALTSLDVSANPKLFLLYCFNMKLPELNLKNNSELDELDCNSCGLASLDVAGCTNLRLLTCSFNKLKTIDVSKNPRLQKLLIGSNMVKTVDVSHNTLLQNLDLYKDTIDEIDLSHNAELTSFGARDTGLKRIDLSSNTKLSQLTLGGDSLVALDLSGLSNISYANTYFNSKYLSHKRNVMLDDNKLHLKTLANDGLDPSRILSVTGGSLSGDTLTFNGEKVSYIYDTKAVNSNYKKFYVELDAANYQTPTGIKALTVNHMIRLDGNTLYNQTKGHSTLTVYDATGRLLRQTDAATLQLDKPGLYIINVGGRKQKVIIR